MSEDSRFRVDDIVQPTQALKQVSPWNPAHRVFGRIVEIEPDVRIEAIHVPGQSHPLHRVVEDRTQYCICWRLPYGDQYVNWYRKEMFEAPPPLIALAACAPDDDEFDPDDDG